MLDIALFLLMLAFPILFVVLACRVGWGKSSLSIAGIIATSSIVPAAWVFLATRDADAITNAAAYFVSPVFVFYGLFASSVTFAFARPK